jgi:hypothetical protein
MIKDLFAKRATAKYIHNTEIERSLSISRVWLKEL